MKKLLFTLLLFFAISLSGLQAQQIISSELLFTWTPGQLALQNIFGAQNDVSMYKIVYSTVDAQGDSTIASGAVFVPVLEGCELPMAVYNHGTIYEKDDVPSNNNSEATVGKYCAAFGFLGLMPDYLGLGDSPGLHPYVHADTEASATIDMMRATQQFCEDNNILLNGQLFLTGYSQGGHAAMATLYEIETNLGDEFTPTAAAPASGPYDMSQTQATPVSSDQPYASPEYLPYVIFSYQSVYGNLYEEVSDYLVSPYDEILPPMFDGTYSGGQIAAVMPEVPSQIIQPDELDDFINNPDNPMRLNLEDNDRYDWTPQTSMRLYYCTADAQVFHENSLVAHETMTTNGAPDVTLVDKGELSHGDCAQPALFEILAWFSELKEDCTSVGVSENHSMDITLFPNPASDRVELQLSAPHQGLIRIHNAAGQTVFSQPMSGNQTTLRIGALKSGMYIVTIDGLPGFHERLMVR